eukprot:TRINITY_DN1069_c0_g2_i1.p1 TRINITY_DN1069_c0_g2~~TRINITY_DN1069_c0_g2_i1.p1  ORF type:complete len:117 (+),score=13.28 TRINITY_DN1069_c0_g2_i1:53-403(+)
MFSSVAAHQPTMRWLRAACRRLSSAPRRSSPCFSAEARPVPAPRLRWTHAGEGTAAVDAMRDSMTMNCGQDAAAVKDLRSLTHERIRSRYEQRCGVGGIGNDTGKQITAMKKIKRR